MYYGISINLFLLYYCVIISEYTMNDIPDLSDLPISQASHATLKFAQSLINIKPKTIKKLVKNKNTSNNNTINNDNNGKSNNNTSNTITNIKSPTGNNNNNSHTTSQSNNISYSNNTTRSNSSNSGKYLSNTTRVNGSNSGILGRQTSLVKPITTTRNTPCVSHINNDINNNNNNIILTLQNQLHKYENELQDEKQAHTATNKQLKSLKLELIKLKQALHSSLKPTSVAPSIRRISSEQQHQTNNTTENGHIIHNNNIMLDTIKDIENVNITANKANKQLNTSNKHKLQERSQTLRYPLQPTQLQQNCNLINNNTNITNNTLSVPLLPSKSHSFRIQSDNTIITDNNVNLSSNKHKSISNKLKQQKQQFQTLPPMYMSNNRPNTAVLYESANSSSGGSPVNSQNKKLNFVHSSTTFHSKTNSTNIHNTTNNNELHIKIIQLQQQLIDQSSQYELQYNNAVQLWSERVQSLQELVLNYQDKQDQNNKTVTDLLNQLHSCKNDYNIVSEKLHQAELSNINLNVMNNALQESIKHLQSLQRNNNNNNSSSNNTSGNTISSVIQPNSNSNSNNNSTADDTVSTLKQRYQQNKQQKNIHSECIEEIENLKFQLLYCGCNHGDNSKSNNDDISSSNNNKNDKAATLSSAPMFVSYDNDQYNSHINNELTQY